MDRPSLKQYDEYNNNNNNNNDRQSHHATTYIDPLAYLSSLPPGYCFEPLPEELIIYYLLPKINNQAMPINLMHTVNIYDKDPDRLTVEHHPQGKKEWYFLTSRNKKYPNGSRPNRKAGDGYWKATGSDKLIEHQGKLVGKYKSLVYFKGKPPNGEKTSWLMVEFRVDNTLLTRSLDNEDNSMKLDDYVLCKIYKNKKVSNKNDQQGQDEEIVQGNNKYQLTIGREIETPLVQNATPSNQYYNDVVPGSIISFKNENNNVGSQATYYNTNNNNVSSEVVYRNNMDSQMICYNANNNNNNNVISEVVYHRNMDSQMICYNANNNNYNNNNVSSEGVYPNMDSQMICYNAAANNNNNKNVSSEVVYPNNVDSQMICYNAYNNNNKNVSSEVVYPNNVDSQMICYNAYNNNNKNVSSEVVYPNNVDSQMICYNGANNNNNNNNNINNVSSKVVYINNVDSKMICYNVNSNNNNNNNNVSSKVVYPNNMDSQVLNYNANNNNNNNNDVNSEAVYYNNTNHIESNVTYYNDNNHKANHVGHQSGGHTIVDSMDDNYEAIFDDLEPLDIGYMNDFVFTV